MFGIAKAGSAHLAVLVAVEENKARIRPMIIGVDRAASVQLVHQWERNLALLDEVGASKRPIRILPHGVDCRQLLKGFLLRTRRLWPALRKGKKCLACFEELMGQGSAGRGEIDPSKMDNEIDRAAAANCCFVIEPPAARDDDVCDARSSP